MKLLDIREVAERLNIAECTARDWVKKGKIPGGYRLGGKSYRVEEESLDSFLSKRRIASVR